MTARISKPDRLQALPKTITVTVPIAFQRRGRRKTVISPVPYAPPPLTHDNALIKALAHAHRWRRMIESGEYASITEVAKAENVNQSYACRLLRLTLLAPEIVQTILDGRQSKEMTLNKLTDTFPIAWDEQRKHFLSSEYEKAVAAEASALSRERRG